MTISVHYVNMELQILKKLNRKENIIMKKYVCTVCGYEYEAENLPEDFVCPLCGVGAELFEEKEEE